MILDIGSKNEIYNIGNIESVKLIDLIEYCKNKLGSHSNINFIDIPKFHDQVQCKDFHMSTKKLYELGFKPDYSLEQSLDMLCH